jgi:curved DNA-binding protein CbpA
MEWYWHFLGLSPTATKVEITAAYRRLAKLLHLDRGSTEADMLLRYRSAARGTTLMLCDYTIFNPEVS